MTLPLIGVGLSYVVVAVLLLSLNLASRWHWGVKAAAIAVTSVFFGVSYASIAGLIVWPSGARVPERFQLDWGTVVEPDKLNGSPGSIYLWVEALDENNVPAGTARDLDVPEAPPDQDRRLAGAPPRQDEPGSPGDPTAFIQHTPAIEFQDIPPPALPPKRPL